MRHLLRRSLPFMLTLLLGACVHSRDAAHESSDDWYYAGCRKSSTECQKDCGRAFKAHGSPEKCPEDGMGGTVACYCAVK